MWLETISGALINMDCIVHLAITGIGPWEITAYESSYGSGNDYEYYYLGKFGTKEEAEQELRKIKLELNSKQ